jgi:hypothetical protein
MISPPSVLVLLVVGLFSDQDDSRRKNSLSKNRLRGLIVQIASPAHLGSLLKDGQSPDSRDKRPGPREGRSGRSVGHSAIGQAIEQPAATHFGRWNESRPAQTNMPPKGCVRSIETGLSSVWTHPVGPQLEATQ